MNVHAYCDVLILWRLWLVCELLVVVNHILCVLAIGCNIRVSGLLANARFQGGSMIEDDKA